MTACWFSTVEIVNCSIVNIQCNAIHHYKEWVGSFAQIFKVSKTYHCMEKAKKTRTPRSKYHLWFLKFNAWMCANAWGFYELSKGVHRRVNVQPGDSRRKLLLDGSASKEFAVSGCQHESSSWSPHTDRENTNSTTLSSTQALWHLCPCPHANQILMLW